MRYVHFWLILTVGHWGTQALPPAEVIIEHAVLYTANPQQPLIHDGTLIIAKGRIVAVGQKLINVDRHKAKIINASGHYVTPGLIDPHSHMGVYSQPEVEANSDGNEDTAPLTATVRAEDSFWPQDPTLYLALQRGGVTTAQILPGSANLIGGQSYVIKLKPHPNPHLWRFPGAPPGLKMACGENPKRIYGNRHQAPATRMGEMALLRHAFSQAQQQIKQQQPLANSEQSKVLGQVLNHQMLVHAHCYRADDLHRLLDLAQDFNFSIRTFHHALEAYKLPTRLADLGVGVATWVDWWGIKLESFDTNQLNIALLHRHRIRVALHSDSPHDILHLNQEAGKAIGYARRFGFNITAAEAMNWLTINPAWQLGIDNQVGSLEVGKMADVVVWDHMPLSVYAKPQMVFIDGQLIFSRYATPAAAASSDFLASPLPEPMP